jgi:ribosome-associated protein
MIQITSTIAIADSEIEENFIRSPGPGGQNVNKVASAVQLRFDLAHNMSLPADVKARVVRLAGNRLTREGVLIIEAHAHRSQDRNRQDALAKLVDLLRRATVKRRPRHKTKPTFGSKQRRLEGKSRRANIKRMRRSSGED